MLENALLCLWLAATAAAGPLTLEQAEALAIANDPQLQASGWTAQAVEAREIQADKIPNPEIEVRLEELGLQRGERDVSRSRIVVSQDLELGRKRGRRVALARAEHGLASSGEAIELGRAVSRVRTRFAEVLGAQRRLSASGAHVEFLESIRARAAALVEQGLLPSIELARIASQLGLARIDAQRAQSELAGARHRLAASWGSGEPQFSEAVGDLARLDPLPDLSQVLALAAQSPSAQSFDSEVARSQAALDLARSNRLPDLELAAGVRWEHEVDADYMVELGIELPIFDRRQGEILERRHELSRAQALRGAASAGDGAAELYHLLVERRATCETLREEVLPAARSIAEAYRTAFESSSAAAAELVKAHAELNRLEGAYAEALVDYRRTLGDLEQLLGRSLDGSPLIDK